MEDQRKPVFDDKTRTNGLPQGEMVPDFDFLNAIGIDLKNNCQKPHYDTDTMETNINGIYLAGVVCGGRDTHLWFIENSRIHAKQIISNIIQKKESEKIPE